MAEPFPLNQPALSPGGGQETVAPTVATGLPKGQATLGGLPVLLSKPIRWALREGVLPVVETFHLRPEDAAKLLQSAPVELRISSPRQEVVFKNLWVIDSPPGPNPYIAAVRVADRRWWWQYGHVLHRFNMRRRVGVKRPPNPTAELQPTLPDIQYARYSLRSPEGGQKWTATEMLKQVLGDVVKTEPASRQGAFSFSGFAFEGLPIENLELDDRADQALARALAYVPGASIFVTPSGSVQVFNRMDGGEGQVAEALKPGIFGMGYAAKVDHFLARPKEIHVLFSFEAEVRFDFKEQSSGTSVTKSEKDKEDQRLLDNVLPIPDFSLAVSGQALAQGTWITVDQAMGSWPAAPGIAKSLDHATLLRAFVPYKDLWGPLITINSADPKNDWSSRVAAIQQHWRRTFRLPQRWVDRALSIRAYRVATVDPTTGSRAPATAYADYVMVPGQRAFFGLGVKDRNLCPAAINVQGYPAGGNIDAATRPTPAEVRIIDSDQGILQMDFLSDPGRVFTRFIPGKINDANMPTGDIAIAGRQGSPVVFNGTPAFKFVALDPNYKMALIVTLIPAAPNSKQQLYRVTVKPDDIQNIVPPFVRSSLNRAQGPPMEVRVPASVETARVRWSDSDATTIAKLFGIGLGDNEELPDVTKLVVNRISGSSSSIGGTSIAGSSPGAAGLENIARAVAARIYTTYADRQAGHLGGDLSAAVAGNGLAGSLEEIVFEVSPDGRATCQLSLPEKGADFPLFSFMDAGTRAIVMHLVNQRAA